ERLKLGLATHQLLGLATDARPDRIHLVERAPGFILMPDVMLGHGPLRELVTLVNRLTIRRLSIGRLSTGAAAWRPYRSKWASPQWVWPWASLGPVLGQSCASLAPVLRQSWAS